MHTVFPPLADQYSTTKQTLSIPLSLSLSLCLFFLITVAFISLFYSLLSLFLSFLEIKTWHYPTKGVACLAKLHVCPEEDDNVKWDKIRVWSALSLESLGLIGKALSQRSTCNNKWITYIQGDSWKRSIKSSLCGSMPVFLL